MDVKLAQLSHSGWHWCGGAAGSFDGAPLRCHLAPISPIRHADKAVSAFTCRCCCFSSVSVLTNCSWKEDLNRSSAQSFTHIKGCFIFLLQCTTVYIFIKSSTVKVYGQILTPRSDLPLTHWPLVFFLLQTHRARRQGAEVFLWVLPVCKLILALWSAFTFQRNTKCVCCVFGTECDVEPKLWFEEVVEGSDSSVSDWKF